MKRQNNKDQRLDELFSEYVQSEQMPSENVTFAAKEYMQRNHVTEKAVVPANATADGNFANNRSAQYTNKMLYFAALFVIVLAVSLLCYFLTKRNNEYLMSASQISTEQLTQTTPEYKQTSFLSFVDENSVTDYKEYRLKQEVKDYHKNDAVMYYVAFNTANNIAVRVYVEVKDIYCAELSNYKQSDTKQKMDGIVLYCTAQSDETLYYFNYNNFGYNITIGTSDRAIANGLLAYITECLTK